MTYQSFVDRYGITDAYELEAMNPADLAEELDSAICEVLQRRRQPKSSLPKRKLNVGHTLLKPNSLVSKPTHTMSGKPARSGYSTIIITMHG